MNAYQLAQEWLSSKEAKRKIIKENKFPTVHNSLGNVSFVLQRKLLESPHTFHPAIMSGEQIVFVKGVYPSFQTFTAEEVLSEARQYQVCATKENGDIEYSNWYDSADQAEDLQHKIAELEQYESVYIQKRLKNVDLEDEEEHEEGVLEKKCPKAKEEVKEEVSLNENLRPGMLVQIKDKVSPFVKKYKGKQGRIVGIQGEYAQVKIKGSRSSSVEFLLTELEPLKEETEITEQNYNSSIRLIRQELTSVSSKIESLTRAKTPAVKNAAIKAEKLVDQARRLFFDIQESALDGFKLQNTLRKKYNLPDYAFDLAMEIINTHLPELKKTKSLRPNDIGRIRTVLADLKRSSASDFRNINLDDLEDLIVDTLEESTLVENNNTIKQLARELVSTHLSDLVGKNITPNDVGRVRQTMHDTIKSYPSAFRNVDVDDFEDMIFNMLEHTLSEDKTDDLIRKYNETGRVAVRYPRKKQISIDGRAMAEKDAIIKMKDILKTEETIESSSKIITENRVKYDSHYIMTQLDMLVKDTDDSKEQAFLTKLQNKIHQSYPNSVTILDIEGDIRNEPSMRYLWDTELWKYVKDQIFTESVISERAIPDRYDQVYQNLINRVKKEIRWDSKPRKFVSSAAHTLEGTVDRKSVVFSWHQPDSKWGPGWAFLGLFVGSKSMFDKDALNFSMQSKKSDADQKKNIQQFEDAIKFVSSGKFNK